MGARWQRFQRWRNEGAFFFAPVLAGNGGEWMTLAPSALLGKVLETLGRKEPEEQGTPGTVRPSRGFEVYRDPDRGVDEMTVFVSDDLEIVLRSYNPGVELKDMTSEELSYVLMGIDDIRMGLDRWGSDYFKDSLIS